MDVEGLDQLTEQQEQSISQLETELRTLQQETSSREGTVSWSRFQYHVFVSV